MSDVLRALEHMARHGGKWYSDNLLATHNGESAKQWFLALEVEPDPTGKALAGGIAITDIEIQNFLADYKSVKRQLQGWTTYASLVGGHWRDVGREIRKGEAGIRKGL